MKEERLKWWGVTFIIISSITIAWWITTLIGADATSLEMFTPLHKRGDFHITDFYNVAVQNDIDNEGEAYFSDKVLIVSIDQLNREQTLEVINKVKQLHPSVIGLDFAFKDSVACHDYILSTIVRDSTIIHATKVTSIENHNYYRREYISFYEKEYLDVQVGYVNIDADYTWNVIRTFHPFVLCDNGDTIPSMALAMAKVANPIRAQILLSNNHDKEIINFVSKKIEVVPASKLENEDIAKRFLGTAVLIGDTAYATDMRITPLREPMSGIYIHAYALQTILSSDYIEEWSTWKRWLMAFIVSVLFVALLQYAKRLNYIGNWLIRVSTFVITILLVYLGYRIFLRDKIYADFTTVISMLVFSSLAFDITYAVIGVVKWIIKKYGDKKSQKLSR